MFVGSHIEVRISEFAIRKCDIGPVHSSDVHVYILSSVQSDNSFPCLLIYFYDFQFAFLGTNPYQNGSLSGSLSVNVNKLSLKEQTHIKNGGKNKMTEVHSLKV